MAVAGTTAILNPIVAVGIRRLIHTLVIDTLTINAPKAVIQFSPSHVIITSRVTM